LAVFVFTTAWYYLCFFNKIFMC